MLNCGSVRMGSEGTLEHPKKRSRPKSVAGTADLAKMHDQRETSLMREIMRRLSIRYRRKKTEKPGEGRRPRPRKYTIFVVF